VAAKETGAGGIGGATAAGGVEAGAGTGAGGRLGFGLGVAGPGVAGFGGVEVAAGGGVSAAAAGGVAGGGSRLSGGGATAAMVVGRGGEEPPRRWWLVWVRVGVGVGVGARGEERRPGWVIKIAPSRLERALDALLPVGPRPARELLQAPFIRSSGLGPDGSLNVWRAGFSNELENFLYIITSKDVRAL